MPRILVTKNLSMKLMSRSTTRDPMLLKAKSLKARPSVPPTREDAHVNLATLVREMPKVKLTLMPPVRPSLVPPELTSPEVRESLEKKALLLKLRRLPTARTLRLLVDVETETETAEEEAELLPEKERATKRPRESLLSKEVELKDNLPVSADLAMLTPVSLVNPASREKLTTVVTLLASRETRKVVKEVLDSRELLVEEEAAEVAVVIAVVLTRKIAFLESLENLVPKVIALLVRTAEATAPEEVRTRLLKAASLESRDPLVPTDLPELEAATKEPLDRTRKVDNPVETVVAEEAPDLTVAPPEPLPVLPARTPEMITDHLLTPS